MNVSTLTVWMGFNWLGMGSDISLLSFWYWPIACETLSPHGNGYEDVTAENKWLWSSLNVPPHVGTAASTLANWKLSFGSNTTYWRTLVVHSMHIQWNCDVTVSPRGCNRTRLMILLLVEIIAGGGNSQIVLLKFWAVTCKINKLNHACHMIQWWMHHRIMFPCRASMCYHESPYQRGLVCHLLCKGKGRGS